jgi:hypothetical protein
MPKKTDSSSPRLNKCSGSVHCISRRISRIRSHVAASRLSAFCRQSAQSGIRIAPLDPTTLRKVVADLSHASHSSLELLIHEALIVLVDRGNVTKGDTLRTETVVLNSAEKVTGIKATRKSRSHGGVAFS